MGSILGVYHMHIILNVTGKRFKPKTYKPSILRLTYINHQFANTNFQVKTSLEKKNQSFEHNRLTTRHIS